MSYTTASRSEGCHACKALSRPTPTEEITPTAGTEARVPRFLRGLGIQTKLVVGAPDDPLEHEADRIAEAVTATPPDRSDTLVQRKSAAASAPSAPDALSGGAAGVPLAGHVRERIEPVLGADLGGVQVHAGPSAQVAAKALNARAFTHQNHIWLGASQSPDDVGLMAHESAHVLQQRAAPDSAGLVQRRLADNEHPEDGEAVQQNMGQQVAKATGGDDQGEGADDANGSEDRGGNGEDSSETRHAARSVDPEERAAKKAALEPYSKPPVDRPAAAQPQVAQAAEQVQTVVEQPAEPLAKGQEKSPAGGAGGKAAPGGDVSALGAAEFALAAAQSVPEIPQAVQPVAPIEPINSEGEALPPDATAEEGAAQLGGELQRMRDEAQAARQRASGLRANAARMRGNIRIAKGASDAAAQGISRAREHVATRREVSSQARDALAVSEEKAATVAAGAPEYAQRAAKTHEDSGPMAGEAQEKAGAASSNTPDDEEAAGKMQAASGQMTQVSADATSVDGAVTGTQAKGETLVQDAAKAQEKNTATAGKLDTTDAAIQRTDDRLGELDQQNATARAQVAGLEHGPARLDAGAASTEEQALAVLAASDDLETQIQAAQAQFAADVLAIPGSKAVAAAAQDSGSAPQGVIQRDANTAYGDREHVDILSAFRSPPSLAERREQEERVQLAANRRRDRLREINERANGHFENLGALDKMGLALDLVGENLMGDLGAAKWTNILGQMALAFVDPRASLEGVVSGLNMTLSGAANLLSLQQWEQDPLGNLLKSAADIATGLTIILGSIAGLCTAILVILGALAIITFGAMGPAFAAASAFLGPIITTVGGWAISSAAIAAELQFYVLIKNLVDAATATTAEGLEHESDQMTEDATQAAGMAAQVVTAGVMEAGGAAFAETATGQRLGALATSVGERFDMIPPPRGAPVLEPGVTPPPEAAPVAAAETVAAPAPAAETPPAPTSAAAPQPIEAPATPHPAEPGAPAARAAEPAAAPAEPTPATPLPEAPAAPQAAEAPAAVHPSEPAAPSSPGAEKPSAAQVEPGVEPARPTTPEEAAVLDSTAGKSSETLTPEEVVAERTVADRLEPEPIDEPPFTTQRELPNGHEIKETPDGEICERCSAHCATFDRNGNPVMKGGASAGPEGVVEHRPSTPEVNEGRGSGGTPEASATPESTAPPESAAPRERVPADDIPEGMPERPDYEGREATPEMDQAEAGALADELRELTPTGRRRPGTAEKAEARGPHPDDMRGNEAEIGSTVPDEPPEGGPFVNESPVGMYDRPSDWPTGMREEVWERARGPDGHVRDPVTNEIMDPNEPWVMGHEPGYEFWKHRRSAAERGITREQFIQEYYESPFRPETPETSASHAGEDKTDLYLGP
ncbi:MAG: DUF4157 domain-containing protein [Betaproteobacteria bacterium]|nr:DUF4157 domain-containing protein [Betaproteobacteria bacterium]